MPVGRARTTPGPTWSVSAAPGTPTSISPTSRCLLLRPGPRSPSRPPVTPRARTGSRSTAAEPPGRSPPRGRGRPAADDVPPSGSDQGDSSELRRLLAVHRRDAVAPLVGRVGSCALGCVLRTAPAPQVPPPSLPAGLPEPVEPAPDSRGLRTAGACAASRGARPSAALISRRSIRGPDRCARRCRPPVPSPACGRARPSGRRTWRAPDRPEAEAEPRRSQVVLPAEDRAPVDRVPTAAAADRSVDPNLGRCPARPPGSVARPAEGTVRSSAARSCPPPSCPVPCSPAFEAVTRRRRRRSSRRRGRCPRRRPTDPSRARAAAGRSPSAPPGARSPPRRHAPSRPPSRRPRRTGTLYLPTTSGPARARDGPPGRPARRRSPGACGGR